jgi:hypothetical protein
MTQSIGDIQKKRGRPKTGRTPVSGFRLGRDLIATLDAWIAAQPDPKPSRSEAIRIALSEWLKSKGFL